MAAEVVPIQPLAQAITDWKRRYNADRPSWERESCWGSTSTFFTANSYLSHHSGIALRKIWEIEHCRSKHVSFDIADKLLVAMNLQFMLATGEIPVVPNPSWGQEKWHKYMAERGCV